MSGGWPVVLDLTRVRPLVVGGGAVALRKVRGLLEAGGAPAVVAPELAPELGRLVAERELPWVARRYEAGDLAGYGLVVAATDDPEVNDRIAADARAAGVLVNVVDSPAASSFLVPATVRRGRVVAAVSTGGASPRFAALLRDRIAGVLTPGVGAAAERLVRLRAEVAARWPEDAERRRRFWQELITPEFVELALAGDDEGLEAWIEGCGSRQSG